MEPDALPHLLKLLLLLAVANGAPVLAKKAWGRTLAQPLDAGLLFLDRRPVFGPTKTVRGVLVSIAATAAIAPLIGIAWWLGALIGATAMAGDLLSSFIKRRLNRPPSSRATGTRPHSRVAAAASRLSTCADADGGGYRHRRRGLFCRRGRPVAPVVPAGTARRALLKGCGSRAGQTRCRRCKRDRSAGSSTAPVRRRTRPRPTCTRSCRHRPRLPNPCAAAGPNRA